MNELHERSIGRPRRRVLKDSASSTLWLSGGAREGATYLAPPTALTELVIAIRAGVPSIFVIGPRASASWKETHGLSATATLNLRPGVVQSVFGATPSELRAAAIPAAEVFDRSIVERTLELARTSVERAALSFAEALAARTRPSRHARFAELAFGLDASEPRVIAEQLGVSARTLRRLVVDELGVTPRELFRFARGGHLLVRLLRRERLAEVALECGYADQAHMSNDVRRLFGRSPTALVHDAANAIIGGPHGGCFPTTQDRPAS